MKNTLLTIVGSIAVAATATQPVNTISITQQKYQAAENLWGIFLDDDSMAIDGGLSAEKIRNGSFEEGYTAKSKEALGYWMPIGTAKLAIETSNPILNYNPRYLHLSGAKGSGAQNAGYFGIGAEKGEGYMLTIALMGGNAKSVAVSLETPDGRVVASGEIGEISDTWKTHHLLLTARESVPDARLVLKLTEDGDVFIDCVSLVPSNAVLGLFRLDVFERLKELRPGFLRFPGGRCVCGDSADAFYDWQETLGDRWSRPSSIRPDGTWSSNRIGFHEFLLLCEELGAAPIYTISAGINSEGTVLDDDPAVVIDDICDCLDYANGNKRTKWGAKRIAAGHEEPFRLLCIEIGYNNKGNDYAERYEEIAKGVKEKHPLVKLIFNNSTTTKSVGGPKAYRDDHLFDLPDAFMGSLSNEYEWPKGSFGIMVGEFAVNRGMGKYGNFRSAIAECAFMIGLENHPETVKLASHASLMSNINAFRTRPSMIYIDSLSTFVSPSCIAQRLMAENRGDMLLVTKTKTKSFMTTTKPLEGKHLVENKIRMVQASVYKTDFEDYIVKVVNCSEKPQPFEVVFENGDRLRMRACRKTIFTAENPNTENTPQNRNNVTESSWNLATWDGVDTLPPLSLTIYAGQ